MSTNFFINYVLLPAAGVFLVGLGLYLYLRIYLRRKMIRSSQDWPIITGTTIGGRVKNRSSEGGEYFYSFLISSIGLLIIIVFAASK